METPKVAEESMKLNRFLALAGYQEGGSLDNVVQWKDHLKVADGYFQMEHHPGTVRSNLASVVKFLRWAQDDRLLAAGIADEAVRKLQGCTSATKKAIIRRAVEPSI
ncbi:hypothetical protein DPMN_041933 [Dreissena polymorpha]|uniref:Uncharacterized protein n=1 Tax=Dreissena polymorpha TaxID=45954 RepID=A0A9D4CXM9_DREPO|nr:hypothetical protein DPMN_041933 [Dreissena polymorpha]